MGLIAFKSTSLSGERCAYILEFLVWISIQLLLKTRKFWCFPAPGRGPGDLPYGVYCGESPIGVHGLKPLSQSGEVVFTSGELRLRDLMEKNQIFINLLCSNVNQRSCQLLGTQGKIWLSLCRSLLLALLSHLS